MDERYGSPVVLQDRRHLRRRRGGRGLRTAAEKLLPYVSPPENIVPGVAALLRHGLPRVPGGLRRPRQESRRPRHQARGQSRSSRQRGRALHPRPRRAAGAVSPRPVPRRAASAASPSAWDDAEKQVADKLAALAQGRQGQKIALVTGLETGRLARLMDEWVKALGARPRIAYEPLGYEAIRAANRISLRPRRHPRLRDRRGHATWSRSARTSSRRGSSPVATRPTSRGCTRSTAGGPARSCTSSRGMSMTAANADQWLRNAPGTEGRSRSRCCG